MCCGILTQLGHCRHLGKHPANAENLGKVECAKLSLRNIHLMAEHTWGTGNEKAILELKQEKSRLKSW